MTGGGGRQGVAGGSRTGGLDMCQSLPLFAVSEQIQIPRKCTIIIIIATQIPPDLG